MTAPPAPIVVATQCFPPTPGGIETVMGAAAAGFARLGHPVRVLADAAPGAAGWDGAQPFPVRRFGLPKPVRRRWKARAAAAALRADPTALLLADSWKSLEFIPEGLAARTICLAHGMEFPPDPAPAKADRIRASLARAGAVIANSRATAALAAPYAPWVTVIHPAVEPPAPPTPQAAAALDAALGPRSALLAALCRLEPRKGVDRAIEALAALLPARPGLLLAVAGDGADRPRLERLAADLGVGRAVRFLGRVDADARAALLSAADVFVMPVRREGASVEGFGVVYLEAATFAVPSIAGRDGGAVDAVRDGIDGLVVDGTDARAVTAAVAALLDDPARRAAMGAAARARALAADWPSTLRRWLAALPIAAGRDAP
jgi:phosphatidylinositol alpha-1,6-mannosyltransferase